MRQTLLTANAVYFLFGATIYCGVMWALHFFFYPSWTGMTVDTVQEHFVVPTSAATRFFLVVVPIMFFSGLVLIATEWANGGAFAAVIIAFLGICASTYVGWIHIIPINRRIKAGVADQAHLVPLLKRWMFLNDVRLVTVTIMWGAIVWYFIAKGDFIDALK
jgi:hypothetical protein